MLQDVVVATNNQGKIAEIQAILKKEPYHIISIGQIVPEFSVVEDGMSYAENAIKKARHASFLTGKMAIADDSGLEVDALGGTPGIYSARFGGEELPFPDKIALLLRQLEGTDQRVARFRCVIAVVSPEGIVETCEGVCEGMIAYEPRGSFGFGFDPIFWLPEYQKTMAELMPDVKNAISHRGKALRQLPKVFESVSAAAN
ncbi:nucleoside-triphosphatase [Candidatus Moduliflexus flocculans]|uniref:dITP/XTP pyrophosphatase n=1 Tax=Candidatus Moduliflexus flocculans TaxID=1499966 RepID=A0A0S6VT90_9BACT|nr:nucleoside-triphosphatase [Candidatus Moduliflexus flocculans]